MKNIAYRYKSIMRSNINIETRSTVVVNILRLTLFFNIINTSKKYPRVIIKYQLSFKFNLIVNVIM